MNTLAAIALLEKILAATTLAPTIYATLQTTISTIKDAIAGGREVTADELRALEDQTNDLMAQIEADAAE